MAVRDATLTAAECVVDAADWAATWVNGEATLMPVLKFGDTDMLSMASRAAISIVNKAFSLEVAKNFKKCHQNGNLVYYEAWKKAPLNNDQKDTLHQLFDRAVCLNPDAHAGLACSTTANWCIVAEHKRSNLLLTRADLAPLFLEGKWLGGELINYYLELLRDQTLASTGRPLAIFSSFFAGWLLIPSTTEILAAAGTRQLIVLRTNAVHQFKASRVSFFPAIPAVATGLFFSKTLYTGKTSTTMT